MIGNGDKTPPGNDIVDSYVELSTNYKKAGQNTLKDKILTFCCESMAAYKASNIFTLLTLFHSHQ